MKVRGSVESHTMHGGILDDARNPRVAVQWKCEKKGKKKFKKIRNFVLQARKRRPLYACDVRGS